LLTADRSTCGLRRAGRDRDVAELSMNCLYDHCYRHSHNHSQPAFMLRRGSHSARESGLDHVLQPCMVLCAGLSRLVVWPPQSGCTRYRQVFLERGRGGPLYL